MSKDTRTFIKFCFSPFTPSKPFLHNIISIMALPSFGTRAYKFRKSPSFSFFAFLKPFVSYRYLLQLYHLEFLLITRVQRLYLFFCKREGTSLFRKNLTYLAGLSVMKTRQTFLLHNPMTPITPHELLRLYILHRQFFLSAPSPYPSENDCFD